MPISEFDIIQKYFKQASSRNDVELGIGDDAAVTTVPEGKELVIAIDTLVAGVHFFPDINPADIAYKALAVNLSDLAAMGAEPAWFTLALTTPTADEVWFESFSKGLFELASQYDLQLIGGDTTQGPLTITIQIAGYVPAAKALTRSGAQIGDRVFVTGSIGDAAAGLHCLKQSSEKQSELIGRLHRPVPRVDIGQSLRDIASACIDVSDGLAADLKHILAASKVGAQIQLEQLPASNVFKNFVKNIDEQYALMLGGGDDYELCFTAPENKINQIELIAKQCHCEITQIGEITETKELAFYQNGEPYEGDKIDTGYIHFKD